MTNSDRPLPSYLDIAINDYEPTVKAKIYEIVAKSGIPHDDPYIAIFLSNAQVAATIATGPTLIRLINLLLINLLLIRNLCLKVNLFGAGVRSRLLVRECWRSG